jgi:hypothetical protein
MIAQSHIVAGSFRYLGTTGKEEGRMYKPILVMIQVPWDDGRGREKERGRRRGETGIWSTS